MTKVKKILAIGALVLAISATSITAFAASKYSSPAEALAGLTGRTIESVMAEKKQSGKTYGQMANDVGKLDEFKKENLQIKKDVIQKRVEDGTITKERADEIIAAMEKNQANCDGSGSARIGQNMGAGFGREQGQVQGRKGYGRGNCQGVCLGNN